MQERVPRRSLPKRDLVFIFYWTTCNQRKSTRTNCK